MTVSLECWGDGWLWKGCEGTNNPRERVKKVFLVPYKPHAVQLTWIPVNVKSQNMYIGKISSKDLPYSESMTDTPETSFELSNTRFILTRMTSDATIVVNDVEPDQIYRITMAPDKGGNLPNIFFKINENQNYTSDIVKSNTAENGIIVRAEEITLVLLILALWVVAIALFVHRWGKIRMLEPYQPDYKHVHEPTCPLNPSTSPTHVPPPTSIMQKPKPPLPSYRVLPRKSSSLCFTPSMLQSGQIPAAWRVCLPQFDNHTLRGLSHTSGSDIPHCRGRFGSDAHIYHAVHSDLLQKARSAENLGHMRMPNSPGKSEENICILRNSTNDREEFQNFQPPGMKESKHPLLLDVVSRGMSLDSAAYNLRRSSAATPSWSTGMGVSCPFPEGIITPEIRISPTPEYHTDCSYSENKSPKLPVSHLHYTQSRSPGIRKQESIKDESTASSYSPLYESELYAEKLANKDKEVHVSISKRQNRPPAFSSKPKSRASLKKENVITSREADDTQDTPV